MVDRFGKRNHEEMSGLNKTSNNVLQQEIVEPLSDSDKSDDSDYYTEYKNDKPNPNKKLRKEQSIYTDEELREYYRKNPSTKKESRYCRFYGCEKQASFGPKFGGKFRCATHKFSTDVNNRAKRCKVEGCMIQPSFGPEDNNKVLRCGTHKLPSDINKTNVYCSHPDCDLTASFGPKNGQKLTCLLHKEKDYVNIKKFNRKIN